MWLCVYDHPRVHKQMEALIMAVTPDDTVRHLFFHENGRNIKQRQGGWTVVVHDVQQDPIYDVAWHGLSAFYGLHVPFHLLPHPIRRPLLHFLLCHPICRSTSKRVVDLMSSVRVWAHSRTAR